jgi:hypothetical protein
MIDLTRRNAIAGLGAGMMLGLASPARALVQEPFHTLMRRVMGLTWVGQARSYDDQFEGGELVTAIGMHFSLNDDWSYEGAMIEILNYGGAKYRSAHRITGECWTIGGEAGVSIYNSTIEEASALPQGFSWAPVKGDFRFYNDSNRKGHFTLQGILTNTRDGGQSRVNMIDQE